VEQSIREFLTIDYSHSVVGKNGDVLIVFFKSGKYWICDKEYGVQQSDNPLYLRVLRIFGAGRTNI
jgi:hypothetical protein